MYNAPVAYPTPPPAPVKTSNGLATAGFVLGLLGFLGSFIPVLNIGGILLGVLGAILAAIGLSKAKKTGTGKGLALSGLILGVLALIIGIVVNVAFAGAVTTAIDDATDTSVKTPATAGSSADADEPADEALGTSRDNPAPLGSAITGGDWTVTINSVETTKKDSFDQAAAEGSVLLVVNMTAVYDGDDAQGSSPWATVNFATADGTTIDGLDGSTLFVPEDQFDSLTTLYEGGSVTGDKIIEVPEGDWESGVLVVSPDLMSDDTFVAVK